MQLSLSLVVLSVLLPAVYAAPTGKASEVSTSNVHSTAAGAAVRATPAKIKKCASGKAEGGIYLVALEKGKGYATSTAKDLVPPTGNVKEVRIINGFSAKLGDSEETVTKLSMHLDVRLISQNCVHKPAAIQTQSNAPWGISRLQSKIKLPGTTTSKDHEFIYEDKAGSCANIYVVDRGVNIHHEDFGGRAKHGKSFPEGGYLPGKEDEDVVGHGTHCAGIAAGTKYGVAKGANIISVKVGHDIIDSLNIILGLGWIMEHAGPSGHPSVVSYSMSSVSNDDMVELSAEVLVESGIHFVASAGNQNIDVINESPASLPTVITVGNSDIHDHRHPNSNFGRLVDVFAPGTDITSTWIGSNTATHVLSGTSMAAPHVAGIVATMLCHDPKKKITPAEMQKMITTNALTGVLQDIPAGTPNRLAHLPAPDGQASQGARSKSPSPPTGRKTPPSPQTGH